MTRDEWMEQVPSACDGCRFAEWGAPFVHRTTGLLTPDWMGYCGHPLAVAARKVPMVVGRSNAGHITRHNYISDIRPKPVPTCDAREAVPDADHEAEDDTNPENPTLTRARDDAHE